MMVWTPKEFVGWDNGAGQPQQFSDVQQCTFYLDKCPTCVLKNGPSQSTNAFMFNNKNSYNSPPRFVLYKRKAFVTTVAVLEHGIEKQSKLIRFLHSVQSLVASSIEKLGAVPCSNEADRKVLCSIYKKAIHPLPIRKHKNDSIRPVVTVLTRAQRCFDLFT